MALVRRALYGCVQDQDAVPEAIHHASMFISELRTSKLSPQGYYELCEWPMSRCVGVLWQSADADVCACADMNVCDQLRYLEQYFENAQDSKTCMRVLSFPGLGILVICRVLVPSLFHC
jgi:hypothetical protein